MVFVVIPNLNKKLVSCNLINIYQIYTSRKSDAGLIRYEQLCF